MLPDRVARCKIGKRWAKSRGLAQPASTFADHDWIHACFNLSTREEGLVLAVESWLFIPGADPVHTAHDLYRLSVAMRLDTDRRWRYRDAKRLYFDVIAVVLGGEW